MELMIKNFNIMELHWKIRVLGCFFFLLFLWAIEQSILNKYNCSGHPANVKDTEEISGQTKNYWISLLVLSNYMGDAPDFRVPYDLNFIATRFWPCPPNNYEININFPKFASTCKKISSFDQFTLLRYSRFQSSVI